jgi:hypothetical protein
VEMFGRNTGVTHRPPRGAWIPGLRRESAIANFDASRNDEGGVRPKSRPA